MWRSLLWCLRRQGPWAHPFGQGFGNSVRRQSGADPPSNTWHPGSSYHVLYAGIRSGALAMAELKQEGQVADAACTELLKLTKEEEDDAMTAAMGWEKA